MDLVRRPSAVEGKLRFSFVIEWLSKWISPVERPAYWIEIYQFRFTVKENRCGGTIFFTFAIGLDDPS